MLRVEAFDMLDYQSYMHLVLLDSRSRQVLDVDGHLIDLNRVELLNVC